MKITTLLCLVFVTSAIFAKNAVIPKIEQRLKKNFVTHSAKGTLQSYSSDAPKNWFNLSPDIDGVEGVEADRTYVEFSKPVSKNEIIVAVIDSGIDINHEDLKGKIWINKDEIPGNGIDDDNNGYIDDVNGWNFIGGKDGRHIGPETLEVTRELKRITKLSEERELTEEETKYFEKVSLEVTKGKSKADKNYNYFKNNLDMFIQAEKVLKEKVGEFEITLANLQKLTSKDPEVMEARKDLITLLENDLTKSYLKRATDYFYDMAFYYYNVDFDPRTEIVGDDQNNPYERYYGNNDVMGPDAGHGTHVSGIIAAVRDNDLGINGIANNVKIMAIRAVPNGDERDKDVANSIRYAVENGAQIINMSFGKAYSPNKKVVDEAIAFAKKHGVLLIHAAGNDGKNNDTDPSFPNSRSENWLEIGASSYMKGEELAADFSNYGKNTVDLFAPGVDILSTTPDDKYDTYSGTSMATPAVSGVAALILSYKKLKAVKLKETILKTSTQYPDLMVTNPGSSLKVPFKDLSINGGIANAYSAINSFIKVK